MRNTAVVFIILWLVASFFIAPGIDTYNHAFSMKHSTGDMPLILRIAGESSSILSNLSILQADLYLHGGVGHFDEEHKEGMAVLDREVVYKGEDLHEKKEEPAAGKFNILLKLDEQLKVSEHVHLKGEEIKEIIPWLYYAAKVDPHNELAYTLAFYYVTDVFGKTEEGVAFLKEGLSKNPDSWQINAELGRFYFQYKKDYQASIRYLTRAYELMKQGPHDKFQERYVLSYLAHSHEMLGEKEKSFLFYKRLNKLFPDASLYKSKLKK